MGSEQHDYYTLTALLLVVNLLPLVRRTLEYQLSSPGAEFLINLLCKEQGLEPEAIEAVHLDQFASRVYQETVEQIGEQQAKWLRGTLEYYGKAALPDRPTDEDAAAKQIQMRTEELDFTFERFVVTRENKAAFNHALLIGSRSPEAPNPLFIYGPVGCGKTHLLLALAEKARATSEIFPRVTRASALAFKSEFLEAVASGALETFEAIYGRADLLLLDDIQFLAGQADLQKQFQKLFDQIVSAGGSIVLTADRPPSALNDIAAELVSSFDKGVTIELRYLGAEARKRILAQMAKERAWPVPSDVLSFIAGHFTGNLRQLKGALNKVVAYAMLTKTPPTAALAMDLLGGNGS